MITFTQHRDLMAADVRKLLRSIRASSPFAMVTKLGIYKDDGAGNEFSVKNRTKNHFTTIFGPSLTFQPIRGQDFNSINN